jgi:hypothetical protein
MGTHGGSRPVATAAAAARDATRLEPLVCFFILFIFYYANILFRFTYHVETAMAATTAAAAARDPTRLEPLV